MKVLQENLEFHTVQNVIDYSQYQVNPIDKTFDVFEVGYEIDIVDNYDLTKEDKDTNNVTNSYLILPQFPFPLSGTLYSPAHIVDPFKESEFQLISFVSSDGIIEEKEIMLEQENTIEEDIIPTDEIIVEENVTDLIIEEYVDEETIIQEEIIEPIIVEPVKEITEVIVTDKETTDSDSSLDISIILVILLVVIIGGVFVYYKKFRNLNRDLKKSFLKKNKTVFNKIIHFDDNVIIKINYKEQ